MGHSPRDVWGYSPRQARAFLLLAEARKREDDAREISNTVMGSRADAKALKKYQKELLRGF